MSKKRVSIYNSEVGIDVIQYFKNRNKKWIPGHELRQALGLSRQQLKQLAREGLLDRTRAKSQRKFLPHTGTIEYVYRLHHPTKRNFDDIIYGVMKKLRRFMKI